jgi:hypothetical protein
MKCEEIRGRLQDVAARGDALDAGLRAHLDRCEGCRGVFTKEQALFEAMDACLRRIADAEAPASLVARVRESAAKETAAKRARWMVWGLPFAVAAMILAVVLLARHAGVRPSEQTPSVAVESATHNLQPAREPATRKSPGNKEEVARAVSRLGGANRLKVDSNFPNASAGTAVAQNVIVPAGEEAAVKRFAALLGSDPSIVNGGDADAQHAPAAPLEFAEVAAPPLQIAALDPAGDKPEE